MVHRRFSGKSTRAATTASFGVVTFVGALASVAHAETKTFDFEGFDKVSVAAGIEATIGVAEDYSVVAETTEEEMERLDIRMNGRVLLIGRNFRGVSWGRRDPVTVTIAMPMIKGLAVSSGARVEADRVDAGDFNIDASSGGLLTVAGRCDALDLDVSSGGRADAESLKCVEVTADASSGGSADVFASQAVSAEASSGGAISVAGAPATVSKETSSGGSVDVE